MVNDFSYVIIHDRAGPAKDLNLLKFYFMNNEFWLYLDHGLDTS